MNMSETCRVCLEDDDAENMISPCGCKGSIKYVHRECLDKWRTVAKDKNNCQLCNEEFNVEHTILHIEVEQSEDRQQEQQLIEHTCFTIVRYMTMLVIMGSFFINLSKIYDILGKYIVNRESNLFMFLLFCNSLGIMVTTFICVMYIYHEKKLLFPILFYTISATTLFIIPAFIYALATLLFILMIISNAYFGYIQFIWHSVR